MSLTVSATSGGFTQVPEGQHQAVCYRLVDSGTIDDVYPKGSDNPSKKRKLLHIFWELPEQLTDSGKPMMISKSYTHSLHESSTLHRDLTGWRGKAFTEEDLAGFDLRKVLGVSAVLEVKLNMNGNAKVQGIFKPDGGAKKTETVNELEAFDIDVYCNEFNGNMGDESKAMCDIYDSLPPWMQEDITGSYEVRAAQGVETTKPKTAVESLAELAKPVEDFDDDIPF